jgi:hypothetical protein
VLEYLILAKLIFEDTRTHTHTHTHAKEEALKTKLTLVSSVTAGFNIRNGVNRALVKWTAFPANGNMACDFLVLN